MKLLILSDLHLESRGFEPTARAVDQADVIVLAGDISTHTEGLAWAWHAFENKRLIYVPGNHEFYRLRFFAPDRAQMLDDMRDFADETSGLISLLDRDECVIDGVRFLGTTLWTNFRLHAADAGDAVGIHSAQDDAALGLDDFRRIGEAGSTFQPEDALREHKLSLQFLLERLRKPHDGKTVVVSHHAPSAKSSAARWVGHPLSPCFASELTAQAFRGVDLWIHGHMHSSSDYMHHGCRVICNPRGYTSRITDRPAENIEFDPELIIDF